MKSFVEPNVRAPRQNHDAEGYAGGTGITDDEYVHEVVCTGCSFAADPPGGNARYDLGNGVTFYMSTEVSWCRQERRLVLAERLESVQAYEDDLAHLESLANVEDVDLVTGIPITLEYRARKIAEARVILDWCRRRTAPPRCLSCGAAELVSFPWGQEIAHEGCPGSGTLYHQEVGRLADQLPVSCRFHPARDPCGAHIARAQAAVHSRRHRAAPMGNGASHRTSRRHLSHGTSSARRGFQRTRSSHTLGRA